jgi:hypothetical protein
VNAGALLIVAVVVLVVGVGVAVAAVLLALRERGRAASSETRALALVDASEEAEKWRRSFRDLVDFLQAQGVIEADADPLALTDSDLVYRVQSPVPGVPEVPGIDSDTLKRALDLLAERAAGDDPRADRPLSRPYLVDQTRTLSRGQFERFRDALIEADLFDKPTSPTASPRLSPKGAALLQAIRDGRLIV